MTRSVSAAHASFKLINLYLHIHFLSSTQPNFIQQTYLKIFPNSLVT